MSDAGPDRTVLRVLDGEAVWPPPIWLMRQAGRHLPEYREVRARAGSFLDLCYNPDLATEVTLQPVRRYGLDAAILFSDILVVPHALGQAVTFAEGEGPRLDPVTDRAGLDRLSAALPLERLQPVFQAVRQLAGALPPAVTLIGFCGAPWTVASYMVAGRTTPDQAPALRAAAEDAPFMAALIDRLVAASIDYLSAQIEAGAQVVQIFESHGAALRSPALLERLSLEPIGRIVAGLRARHPGAKVIVFVRGIGERLPDLAGRRLADGLAIADGLGLDYGLDLAQARALIPERTATQGNLDPEHLVAGGPALDAAVDSILAAVKGRPHIFNLGHGVVPATPIPHVERMIARVRAGG